MRPTLSLGTGVAARRESSPFITGVETIKLAK